jgi:alpha-L-fucosidase 2
VLRISSQIACLCALLPVAGRPAESTTAWHDGQFNVDVPSVVGRSDIILQRPNARPEDAMPLGNGRLGIAIWAADGMTIQLNRADTLPGRLSPGQIVVPGLSRLTSARDYAGRVDLYNGEFTESGNGMSATVSIDPDLDVVVVDVKGTNAKNPQTVEARLWSPRHARAQQQDTFGVLSETWIDSGVPGATGQTFGSLAAITAQARNVRVQANKPSTEKLSFLPNPDGSFRVLIASPAWRGGDPLKTAQRVFSSALHAPATRHRDWWNRFWNRAGLMKLTSSDRAAEYLENLRLVDLFTTAGESRGPMPGSQAGVGDLYSSAGDFHQWDPAAYWHWNLRMQVAANLSAGLFELNQPYFRLYTDNLANIQAWTKRRMENRPGVCVPETMRFNGQGFENEGWTKSPGRNCDAGSPPYYNARTISTGAEVSFWIWRQYLVTGDEKFLAANYPIMADAARFLLAYSRTANDGLRHTSPSNAHENQWDVHDPITDLCAMKTLFPAVIEASRILHKDPELVEQASAAMRQIPELPRTDAATLKEQLSPADDTKGNDVIAQSYDQAALIHNSENLGLEPVWPYSLIGDDGALHELAVRTYWHRPNKSSNDWSYDPLQAARLGLSEEVKASLLQLTEKYQAYPSGLASFVKQEFYIEQIGVVAAALDEALIQDYDGLLRIAPAWPRDWDADATVYVERNSKVHVQVRQGRVLTVVFQSGFSGPMHVRNPWPGTSIEVTVAGGRTIHSETKGSAIEFAVERGKVYLIRNTNSRPNALRFEPVNGSRAALPKSLGSRTIGLWR